RSRAERNRNDKPAPRGVHNAPVQWRIPRLLHRRILLTNPSPAPPEEGSFRARAAYPFPSWEGFGVASRAVKRLSVAVSLARSFLHACGSFDGRDDARIGAAATNVPLHGANDFRLRRV